MKFKLPYIVEMNEKIYKITRLRTFNNFKGEILPSCDAMWFYKEAWHDVKCEQLLIDLRKKFDSISEGREE